MKTAKLLVQSGIDVNSEGKFAQRTILHCAAAQGDTTFVYELVGKDARIRVKDNEGKTPIDYALTTNNNELAEYLEQNSRRDGCCVVL